MFTVLVQDEDTLDWVAGGTEPYAAPEDAVEDYGEENVRVVVPGKVYSLHEDERDNGEVVGLLVLEGL